MGNRSFILISGTSAEVSGINIVPPSVDLSVIEVPLNLYVIESSIFNLKSATS